MRLLAVIITLSLIWPQAESCGPKKKKNNDRRRNPRPPPLAEPPVKVSAINRMLGDGVIIESYDNTGYDSRNGMASAPQDLPCSSEMGTCCWKNSKPPYDTLDWALGRGSIDPYKFQRHFGTSTVPTGNFLVTYNEAGAKDKAEFLSCVIECSDSNVDVTFKHWVTDGVKIEVCQVAENDPSHYSDCHIFTGSAVSLPPGSKIYIAITATDLMSSKGNIAIMQDLKVRYTPCSRRIPDQVPREMEDITKPPRTEPPITEPPITKPRLEECRKLECDFNQDLCYYRSSNQPIAPGVESVEFTIRGPGPHKNPSTGIEKSPDDSAYAAAYLLATQNAYIEVDVDLQTTHILTFQEYAVTNGIQLRVCCDALSNCPYRSGPSVERMDFRQWYMASITCPAGTRKIIFFAENIGPNEGAVGIDNIRVVADPISVDSICV